MITGADIITEATEQAVQEDMAARETEEYIAALAAQPDRRSIPSGKSSKGSSHRARKTKTKPQGGQGDQDEDPTDEMQDFLDQGSSDTDGQDGDDQGTTGASADPADMGVGAGLVGMLDVNGDTRRGPSPDALGAGPLGFQPADMQ